MKLIKVTRGLETMVDDEDYEYLNQWKWQASKERNGTCYVTRTEWVASKHSSSIRYPMHRIILKAPKGTIIDHIDRNGLNNQKSNLRFCTNTQNGYNRPVQSNSLTGYKGVTFDKRSKRYNARITYNKKAHHIGRFDCPIEAAKAYDKEAIKNHGEFAWLNFPKKLLTPKK